MRTFVLILCSFLLAWRPIPAPAAGSAEGSESAESAANVLLEHAHEPWKGDLDGMDELAEKWGVAAWKCYTQWGPDGRGSRGCS